MIPKLVWFVLVIIISGTLAVGCAPGNAPSRTAAPIATQVSETLHKSAPLFPTRAPERVKPTPIPTLQITTTTIAATNSDRVMPSATAAGRKRFDVEAFLPPARARELFFNYCVNCHSFVCSMRGQRSRERWDVFKFQHRDKLVGLADADYELIFDYLKENFDDTKPEPELPPELLEGINCTPL